MDANAEMRSKSYYHVTKGTEISTWISYMTIDSKPVIYEYLKFHCVYNFFIEFNFRNSMTSQEVVDFVREKMKEEENKKQLSSICEQVV